MTTYKDKEYLVFKLDDGSTVKYNLATTEVIGKRGKIVKSLNSQLRGYSIPRIIDAFEDEVYKAFLQYVWDEFRSRFSFYNPGRFLSELPRLRHYEQIFSAGIKKVGSIKSNIKDIPKGLLILCREKELKLDQFKIDFYKNNPDVMNVLYDMELTSLTNDDVVAVLEAGSSYRCGWNDYNCRGVFAILVNEFNYKPQTLLKYIDNLITYEAMSNGATCIRELYDYVYMMSKISSKFDKYPKHFLTTHAIASRNYNRLKEQFEESNFEKRMNLKLEYQPRGNLFFKYPESTQDIKDEAVQQNNCVASYINRVIDGECHILFLRDKKSSDKSLVTIEVRDYNVAQAKGRYNRDVTEKEQEAIDKYNMYLERLRKEDEKIAS